MSETVEITGASEVMANLQALDREFQNVVIRKGLKIGGNVLLSAAKADAPTITGNLRDHIKLKASAKKGVFRSSVTMDAKDYTGEAFYASFVLFGHKAGSRKLGANRKDVPANNFLKRAAQQSGEAAAEETIEAWRDFILVYSPKS